MHFDMMIVGKIPNGKGNKNPNVRAELRRQVHEQLAQVWQMEPLRDRNDKSNEPHRVARHGKEFVALATVQGHSACKLKVVFYEPEGSLDVTSHVADADNRLSGLLDLLSIPVSEAAAALLPDLNYTLMQDDKLLWSIAVERKRLLRPIAGEASFTRLEVQIIPTRPTWSNIALIDLPVR